MRCQSLSVPVSDTDQTGCLSLICDECVPIAARRGISVASAATVSSRWDGCFAASSPTGGFTSRPAAPAARTSSSPTSTASSSSAASTSRWCATAGTLLAYCLMGTHYHLVLDVEGKTLPEAMRWLNGVYARRFNKRHERRGHLLGARYNTWFIRDERHYTATIRYVLDNPVRAGLCERPEEWPWSYAAETLPRPSRRSRRGRRCARGRATRRASRRAGPSRPRRRP